jgi:hypothetical protein
MRALDPKIYLIGNYLGRDNLGQKMLILLQAVGFGSVLK